MSLVNANQWLMRSYFLPAISALRPRGAHRDRFFRPHRQGALSAPDVGIDGAAAKGVCAQRSFHLEAELPVERIAGALST